VVVEVANGRKAILTLTLIHSLSCGRPTAYVSRGHYFRFNGVATCGREKKKKRRLTTASNLRAKQWSQEFINGRELE